jgi:formylglycine-generating enzyme required for sulfatase activity
MGDIQGDGDSDEQPVHDVTIAPFAMGRYEVTFEEYDRFANATGHKKPNDEGWGRGRRPVINVSWSNATAYAQWLSRQTGHDYRLPSEAEWEYAARAGTETKYWWGNSIGRNRAACNGCGAKWGADVARKTAPVGSFATNPFGLYDTAGNVWEWAGDCWHRNYSKAPSDGSTWLDRDGGECARRVLRGGGWFIEPRNLRSADRHWYPAGAANGGVGIRLARTL